MCPTDARPPDEDMPPQKGFDETHPFAQALLLRGVLEEAAERTRAVSPALMAYASARREMRVVRTDIASGLELVGEIIRELYLMEVEITEGPNTVGSVLANQEDLALIRGVRSELLMARQEATSALNDLRQELATILSISLAVLSLTLGALSVVLALWLK